jgi:membrane-associated phospholipid phosphatase
MRSSERPSLADDGALAEALSRTSAGHEAPEADIRIVADRTAPSGAGRGDPTGSQQTIRTGSQQTITLGPGTFEDVGTVSGATDLGTARLGTTSGTEAPVVVSGSAGRSRSRLWVEVAWLVFLIWIYDWLEDLAPLRRKLAFVDAGKVLSFERSLHLDPERALDHWLAHQQVLAFLASNFYSNAIFAVTFGFAAYIWWRRPDLYRNLRFDLILANLIGFAVFWAFPVAPPRMLSGFIDVVQTAGGVGAWHDTLIKHADQFAAMPSMHLGYAVWCSVVAWRVASHHSAKVKALIFGTAYPLLTAFIVMSTGNHYLTDVVAGTAVTFLAIAIVEVGAPAVDQLVRGYLRSLRDT